LHSGIEKQDQQWLYLLFTPCHAFTYLSLETLSNPNIMILVVKKYPRNTAVMNDTSIYTRQGIIFAVIVSALIWAGIIALVKYLL
jgi:hypothetical protein